MLQKLRHRMHITGKGHQLRKILVVMTWLQRKGRVIFKLQVRQHIVSAIGATPLVVICLLLRQKAAK